MDKTCRYFVIDTSIWKKRDRNYDLDSEVKVNIKFGSQKWNILNYFKQHVKYSMKAILVLWDVCFYGTFLSGN